MKLIDKYLIKQFLSTIFFALLAFTLVFVIIDVMENLDDFLDQNVVGHIILLYYLVFTPEIIKMMIPVAVLFSTLYTVGRASNFSELTAIKASGVSIYKFMMPFIYTTLGICFLAIIFSGFIVPYANKTKTDIERKYLDKRNFNITSNIYFQDSPTRMVSISYFDERRNQINRISIQKFSENDLTKITSRIDAPYMRYDTTNNVWIAFNGTERIFLENRQEVKPFNKKIFANLHFKPSELSKKQQKPEEMNLFELKDLIKTQQNAGTDPVRTQIEYYSRFSFGMSSLIVVLFGLTISTNKRGGTIGSQIGINILATFLYLVFMKISQAFGKNGALDPMLTAWFANFLFLAAALFNVPKIHK